MDSRTLAEHLDGTEEQLESVLQYLVDLGTEETIALLLQRLDGPVSPGGERKQFHEAFEADSRLALALLTLDDLRAHTRLIGDALPYQYSGDDAVLKGLVYRDEDPIIPFAANPWNIAPMAQLDEALRTVWSRPEFETVSHKLRDNLFGLALVQTSSGPLLAYIMLRVRDYEGLRRQAIVPRQAALSLSGRVDVCVMVGGMPAETEPMLPLPPMLCDLYKVHAQMTDGMWRLYTPTLSDRVDHFFSGMDNTDTILKRFEEIAGAPPERFLFFFSYGDDRSNLLALEDGTIHWLANPWTTLGEGQTPKAWLNEVVEEQWLYLDTIMDFP